jgi:signal transduction histidine kinase
MWGLERLNQLSQCVLMTVNGNIVADSTGKTSPGSAYVFRDTDRHAIDTAASGQPAAMRLYPVGDQLFKRVYVPLVSGSKVIGVVQVAASADYFAAMREDQRRARFQMLVSSALLLLIGFSIYRLFAHLVQAEKRAVQLARIEAMGALAGGVAHELRNPLSIIRVLSEEILTEQPPDSPSARNARDVIAEIERLNEMVTHYLSLSKLPDATGLEVIDLGGELARVAQLMRKGAETNLEVKTELPAAPVYVRADSRALRQVFLNLLLNARDALPGDGGEVRVTLRERRGSAEIHVIDTGCGIPAREIARVFEPFYSTKRMGTGLGLPITRSIVENLGGEMAITSNPGKGTDVCVILPATLAPEGTSGS